MHICVQRFLDLYKYIIRVFILFAYPVRYLLVITSGLNLAYFTLSRDNQILIFIISRQSNYKFHYLETFEIMKVYNKCKFFEYFTAYPRKT